MTDLNDYKSLLMALKAVDSKPSMAKEFLFANLTTIYQALTVASKLENDPYTATFDPPEPFQCNISIDTPVTRKVVEPLTFGEIVNMLNSSPVYESYMPSRIDIKKTIEALDGAGWGRLNNKARVVIRKMLNAALEQFTT